MHCRLEIVLPPGDDIEAAIDSIMAPFNENGKDEDGSPNKCAFWDFYVIGGRFAGSKQLDALGRDKVQEFYNWSTE